MIKRLLLTALLLLPSVAQATDKPINFYSYPEAQANTTSYLSIPDSDDWWFDGDFTIELWVRTPVNSAPYQQFIMMQGPGGVASTTAFAVSIESNDDGKFWWRWYGSSGLAAFKSIGVPSLNTTYHLCFTRKSNIMRFYVDGVLQVTPDYVWSNNTNDSDQPLIIGKHGDPNNGYYFTGYIDEVRISKGICRYPTTASYGQQEFTPPTAPFTTDSYTKLLLHFDNNVNDDSGQNHVVTNNGVGFSTIGALDGYSARFGPASNDSVNKPINFYSFPIPPNNSTSYLSTPDSDDWYLTGDMTIECFFYAVDINPDLLYALISQHNTTEGEESFRLAIWSNSRLGAHFSTSAGEYSGYTAPNTVTPNAWHHVALVKYGTSLKLYLDGVGTSIGVGVSGAENASIELKIGASSNALNPSWYFPGYIDEVRISKGVARYTSDFIPPTSPFITDSYTKLLLHFDGDIVDASGQGHVLTNNGNVTFSSTIAKFGNSARFGPLEMDYVNKPINFYSRTE